MDALNITDEQMLQMKENSYRDYHAKGLDYLCLYRSPKLTRKAYFFDGDMSKLPEIVMPHDHRYPFRTSVLAGQVANILFAVGETIRGAETYERFDYLTPLNGGDGFTWSGTAKLRCVSEKIYKKHNRYSSSHIDVHTLRIVSDQCILLLDQFADVIPASQPTKAYRRKGKEPPSLSGLYETMSEDYIRALMKRLTENGYEPPPETHTR